MALAVEIRGATSVTVIERGTHNPLWCMAVERTRAVGSRTTDVLAVAVMPSEVRGAVSHIAAAVRAADALTGTGGPAGDWTELVLVDEHRLHIVRALTAAMTDGLIVCLTLDRRDANLASARREFERLVAAEQAGAPLPVSGSGRSGDVDDRPAEPANGRHAVFAEADDDRHAVFAEPEDGGAVATTPGGLPRRDRHGTAAVVPDFDRSWTNETDLDRIVVRLRRLT